MDPLSIGSAVVGLIAAASRIGPVLYHFIANTRDAPSSAAQLFSEMQGITAVLQQLQAYLIDASESSAGRRAMLSLRNIMTSLTACVTTYSRLERLVGKCVEEGQLKRVKWLLHEREISELAQKVQGEKLNLVFMLTILQCESQREAEMSMQLLNQNVERLNSSNEDIKHRIDTFSIDHASPTLGKSPETDATCVSPLHVPAYEVDLSGSRVYRRVRPRASVWSVGSTDRVSMALSVFSNLTVDDVSNVSVLCLPIWSSDISNASHYRFRQ
ncbi:hypothetical protein K458DRAFT_269951, partial [Lentithecium fluviatile CBS 122367]